MIMQFNFNMDFEELIKTLKNGSSQKFEDFVILRLKSGRIEVRGYIQYNTVSEIPKEIIKDELQKIKNKFISVMNKSEQFKILALEFGIDYSLDLDYGGGSILICTEKEGVYKT